MMFQQGPRLVLAVIVAACAAFGAHADDPATPPTWPSIPPAEAGDPTFQSRLNDARTQVELVDTTTGQPIVGMVDRVYLWDDYNTRTALRPTVELRPQPTGFDMVYTFTNDTAEPKALGRLRMGSMLMGSDMTWQDYTYLGEDRPSRGETFTQISRNYPASWYSPVMTLRNANYSVGVSLLYPMMEYKHDVRILLNNNSVEGRRIGWEAIFQLQNYGDEGRFDRVAHEPMLAPGETHTYIVSVRVSRNRDDYLRTLLPYRDFFLKFYGGVRYSRDPEPIIGFATGILDLVSADNPYGFAAGRPDLNGWNGFTSSLRNLPGWKNVMVWLPTGHYRNNISGNMPFQFTSQWLTDPELATALDPNVGFPTVAAAGKNLGFWWGHSASVYSTWDSFEHEPLDPDNPEHVRRGFAELDLAVQAGATMIGLDAFHPWYDAPWNLTRWIQMMRNRHPQVRFVSEAISFDILHSLTPAFITGFITGGNPRTLEDLYPLKQPHTLANFVLPGNEIWASMLYQAHGWLQIPVTEQLINDDVTRYARLGFTPLIFPYGNVTLQNRPDQKAAEAWKQIVPADLLASYKWNRNYTNGAVVRRSDGSMAIIEASSPGGSEARTPPPQPAPPPEGLDGGGGGGMVLGSAPDAARHSAKGSKRAKNAAAATAVNLNEVMPNTLTSTLPPDLSGAGKVDTKVPGRTVKQNTKVNTSVPKDERHDVMPSPASNGAMAPVSTRGGPISVVPSSIPGLRRPDGAPAIQAVAPGRSLEAGLNLTAVRQAILRIQRSRPVAGAAGVVEVER